MEGLGLSPGEGPISQEEGLSPEGGAISRLLSLWAVKLFDYYRLNIVYLHLMKNPEPTSVTNHLINIRFSADPPQLLCLPFLVPLPAASAWLSFPEPLPVHLHVLEMFLINPFIYKSIVHHPHTLTPQKKIGAQEPVCSPAGTSPRSQICPTINPSRYAETG